MALDRKPVLPADSPVQTGLRLDAGQIQNGSAAVANKMTMWGDDCVKALLSLNHADALDQAVFPKKVRFRYTVPRLRSG